MQLKLFITTDLSKNRIGELFRDNLQTYIVTSYAFPSMKTILSLMKAMCLAVIRELPFSYSVLSISCLLHNRSELGYAENNM